MLNLIDAPSHVDLTYDVSRSTREVEGSLLVVDSPQGVGAQTLANVYQTIGADHEIVPVLKKIDLLAFDCYRATEQIEDVIGVDGTDTIQISVKTGYGIYGTLEAIAQQLSAPQGSLDAPLKAMLVASWYDTYLGVIVLGRIVDGRLKKGMRDNFMSNNTLHHVDRVSGSYPEMGMVDGLDPGEIGFLTALIKQVLSTRVDDTITNDRNGTEEALDGFEPGQPVVFCGIFPVDSSEFEDPRDVIDKLALNDASFSFEMETSVAHGFRCVFLGLLHLADMSDPSTVEHIEKPRIKAIILVPDEYFGNVLKFCQDRRGIQPDLTYAGTHAMVVCDMPLNEVFFDFYDCMKSVTKGYVSFDYRMTGFTEDKLVKMSVLANDKPVDALPTMVYRDRVEMQGRAICEKLKDIIPRHMFNIPIQAVIGGKVTAHETLSALRKDVTAKCYGGTTRKGKLLDEQKACKGKMRQFRIVDILQEAFVTTLKMDG